MKSKTRKAEGKASLDPLVVRSRVWIKQPNFWRGWRCVCASTAVLAKTEAERIARFCEGMTAWKVTHNAGAVPRRDSDVGTSPLLGQKSEEA